MLPRDWRSHKNKFEEKSIVLLKNNQSVLPIDPSKIHSIAIIGGHADVGMISGGGSGAGGPAGRQRDYAS